MKSLLIFIAACFWFCLAGGYGNAQTYHESVLSGLCAASGSPCAEVPVAGVTIGANGTLYGLTSAGTPVADAAGVAYAVTSSGEFTPLYAFCSIVVDSTCVDGLDPNGSLTPTPSGDLYGATYEGGTGAYGTSPLEGYYAGYGTVFQLTESGGFLPIHNFCSEPFCADGSFPNGGLLFAPDGNFYGTTEDGGATSAQTYGYGTVFRLSPSGELTTLYRFCSTGDCSDGSNPVASVVLGPDDALYGTTTTGGTTGGGTIFRLSYSKGFQVLHTFCQGVGSLSRGECLEGYKPLTGLTVGQDNFLYGTTSAGGSYAYSSGTIFRISTSGSFEKVLDFCGYSYICAQGPPSGPLLYASDGNLYWAAGTGIARVSTSGAFSSIYTFCSTGGTCTDGNSPVGSLVQGSSGTVYGATANGGTQQGTVFSLAGVSPSAPSVSMSVSTSPSSVSVGQDATLIAKLSPSGIAATGTVTFFAGVGDMYPTGLCSATISGNAASCTVSTDTLTPAAFSIFALYSGDSNYSNLTVATPVTLQPSPTLTTLSISPTTVTPPGAANLTATVKRSPASDLTTSITGSVGFYYGSYLLGYVNLNADGQATLTEATSGYPAGTYGLTARYLGDTLDGDSTSPVVNITLK